MTNKKHQLNLVLNNMNKDVNDPTLVKTSMIILDFTRSHNNVIVKEGETETLRKTIKNKPIVCKYVPVSEANAQDDSFTSHNEFLSENKYGEMFVDRDTIAIGVFTSEGYITEVEVDGEMRRVLMADGVLWYSKYPDAVDLLLEWYSRGININMSCEYLYSNHSFIDGVEYHYEPLVFEAHALLNSEKRNDIDVVTPAYESATIVSLNELKEFNRLVASAINQNKEVSKLPKEEKELEVQTNETVTEAVEDLVDTAQEVVEKADEVVKAVEEEEVVEEEKVDYESITNELKDEVSQLNSKIEQLIGEKSEIATKLESATETIAQLNSQLEELKEIKQQIMNAEREVKLQEAREKYSKVLNATILETEDVQKLIANSIEEGEAGVNAKLALTDLILEQVNVEKVEAKEEVEVEQQFNAKAWVASLNSSKRKFEELEKGEDPLAEFRA